MDKIFVISAVIVILIIITYYLVFSPSQRRERRLSKKQKEGEVKKMHLRQKELQEMHYGKVLLLFLDHKEVYLMDEEHKRVSDFDKSIISLTFFKENNFIKIIPVIITGIELFKDSDFDMVVEFNISDQWYDFKIVFIDKLVVVAYSSLLGTITLYLNQCPQAEIGKMIKVKVTQKRFHSLLNKIEVKVKHSL